MKTFIQSHRHFSRGVLSALLLTTMLASALLVENTTSHKSVHASAVVATTAGHGTALPLHSTFTIAANGTFPYVWNAPRTIQSVQLTPPYQTFYDGSDNAYVQCPNIAPDSAKHITVPGIDGDEAKDPQLAGSCTYTAAFCRNAVTAAKSSRALAASSCPAEPCSIFITDPQYLVLHLVSTVTVHCTEIVTLIIIDGGTFYKDTKASAPGYGAEVIPAKSTAACRLATDCSLVLDTPSSAGFWSSSASGYVLGYGALPIQYSPYQVQTLF